jgi:hypothetical protein
MMQVERPREGAAFGTILPGDIGDARERLNKLEEVVESINSIAGCNVLLAQNVGWSSAELSVSVDFEKLLGGGDEGGVGLW